SSRYSTVCRSVFARLRCCLFVSYLLILRPLSTTLFPYTTLFRSGGKTTITRLIARFWDVQEGSITIGGHDVKEFTCDSLLKNMRSEEHTSELQSRFDLVCRLLLEKTNAAGGFRSPSKNSNREPST